MKENIMPAIRLTLVCLVFFCGIYTLLVLGLAQLTPGKGGGETINENGKRYYANVGQKFTDDRYFWSRPSAVDYNAAGAAGSNKGPSNPDYLKTVQERIDTFLVHNRGIRKADIPSDLVTASGSGLDPHISVQAAQIQVKRVAAARRMDERRLQQLVTQYTEKPLLGLLGVGKINVLQLNIALDQLK
ncbi:K(+)-transporting ATPase subunit C [Niabella yanshanensis]|uniref:Potassium-transporting ATPase KdpC subunit n=1 Tax=Niabella yanshanensis TaxID=577386 RepID=A0ABZ0W584_9BACT|nr:K(+)-transporting ATPase subunit C [Niabella yanshanensis]WQD37709.1 K(+)-transporting ATPase subunit C [Niabella yanshanensis]